MAWYLLLSMLPFICFSTTRQKPPYRQARPGQSMGRHRQKPCATAYMNRGSPASGSVNTPSLGPSRCNNGARGWASSQSSLNCAQCRGILEKSFVIKVPCRSRHHETLR